MLKGGKWMDWFKSHDGDRKRAVILALIVNFLLFSIFPTVGQAEDKAANIPGASKEAIEESISIGENWLLGSQNSDGSWGTHFAEKMRNTSETAQYLHRRMPDEASLSKAKEWLGSQETANSDFLARVLASSMKEEGAQQKNKILLDTQNPDGGWGLAKGYDSDVFDTVLVLGALIETQGQEEAIKKGITYLLNQQNENGSWGFNHRQRDSVLVTSQIILLFNDFTVKNNLTSLEILTSMKQAGDYLLLEQQEDQTWGLEGSALSGTLFAYQAVLQTNGLQPVGSLLDQVIQLQEENGSWNNDPYITLLALQALRSYQEATSVVISDIGLYRTGQSGGAHSFSAYETIEIKPVYESTLEQVQVMTFIKTPEGRYQAVQSNENLHWETKNHKPGEYTAIVQIKDMQSGRIAASAEKTFTINPTFQVENTSILLSPESTVVGQSKDVKVQASILHSSNIDGELTGKVEVYDQSGKKIASEEKGVTARADQPILHTNMLSFTPEVGDETTYTIKSFVHQDGQLVAEAEKSFEVLPPPPPTRIDVEQSQDKQSVNPGSDTVQADFLLKGMGAPTEPERLPLDMVFVLDVSGSMSGSVVQTKEATKKLMELIQTEDRGAVVFFHSSASIIQNFTSDINLLKTAADKAYASGGTSIHAGISKARELFTKESNSSREKVIVLLSDGGSTRSYALNEALLAKQQGITIHTIGLGSGVDRYLMEQVALTTSGTYKFSPSVQELEEMMNEIGGEIFNLAGKDVTLSTTLPNGLSVDQDLSNPAPARIIDHADGTKRIEWNYDLIVMNQTQPITLALKGSSFMPGETAEITTNTKLAYTAKNGEAIVVPLPNMEVKVHDSLETNIELSGSRFAAKEDVGIAIEVKNRTDHPANLTAVVEIIDYNGEIVTDVGTYTIEELEAKGIHLHDLVWNTGTTYAGEYAVKVTLKAGGEKVSETTAPFAITPQGEAEITVTTDKAEYQSGEDVQIQHRVENKAVNKDYENLHIKTSILNAEYQTVFEQEQDIHYLSAQQIADRSMSWESGQSLPGTYTVKTELWDGEVLLSSYETSITMASTAATGYGLNGSLKIGEKKVISGKPVDLSYSVVNSGNSDMKDAKLEVLVIQPETEKVVKTFEQTVQLTVGQRHSHTYSYQTKGLKTGSYLVVLRAALPNGERVALDSASFTVDKSIEIDKTVMKGSRVLVWTENLESNQWISSFLKKKTDYHHVVDNHHDFMKELRSNKYNVYFVTDTSQPLTGNDDQELLAKVHNGAGLIVTENANLANLQTFNVFGAKLNGTQDVKGSGLYSAVFPDLAGHYSGKIQKYDLAAAGKVWAAFGNMPAIISNQYGLGKAVHIGFDITQLKGTDPVGIAGSILEKILPQDSSSAPGEVQMVEVRVKANGGPFDVQITERVSEGVHVIDSMDFTRKDDQWMWRKTMEPDEEVVLHYLLVNPQEAGVYSLKTENGLWDEGEYFPFEAKELKLGISQSEELLLLEAIDELDSSSIKGKGTLKKLSVIFKRFIVYPPTAKAELEFAMDEISKNLHLLANEANQDSLRWRLEEVLSLYQSEWYMGGSEE
jgi:Mg-chelatase subunit ChlD